MMDGENENPNWRMDDSDYWKLVATSRTSFVYSLYHKPTSKTYIGSKISTSFRPIDTIFETYFTSSKVVQSLFDENGFPNIDEWDVSILEEFLTYPEAVECEDRLLRSIPKDERCNYLNINFSAGGSIVKSGSHYRYKCDNTGDIIQYPKDLDAPKGYTRVFTTPPSRKGFRKWIFNGDIRTTHTDDMPDGAILYSEYLRILNPPNKPGAHCIGVHMITDGDINRRVKKELPIPLGFYIGSVPAKSKILNGETTKGKVKCTDGYVNKYFKPDQIPEGWIEGSLPKCMR